MAISDSNPDAMRYLQRQIFSVKANQFKTVRQYLKADDSEFTKKLWDDALNDNEDVDRRFRAACVLADLDSQNENLERSWSFQTGG